MYELPRKQLERVARELAFNVESWSENGLRYVVIGDAGPADVHELSELLRTASRS